MALEVAAQAAGPIPLDLQFSAAPGEILALVGPSGAGKSTLLRSIAGLWTPTHARVAVNGDIWLDTDRRINLPPHRRRVGLVVQSYALFPHMTAAGNVAAALPPGHPHPRAEAGHLLALVGLADVADRLPAQLSGGQQQRVALARALARAPSALLLDEPFSAVDLPTRERLYAGIHRLRDHLKMPVVLVTHDLEEARLLADRMVVMEAGRAVGQGTVPEVMADPAALRGMGLRAVAATLHARVVGPDGDGLTQLETAGGPLFLPRLDEPPGRQVRVRIMAHDVILSRHRPEGLSALNILSGTVRSVTAGDGPGAMVRVAIGEDEILARITRRSAEALGLAAGVECFAILKAMSVARGAVSPAGD